LLLPEQGYLLTTSSSINNSLFSKNLLWTGSHSPRGLIAIRGPGVMPGRITGATLVDVMPTILYAMRLTIPGGIDGKVLSGAFTPKHIKENPILKETDAEAVRIVERGLSEEEEMKMEERLRQLGYLG